MAFWSKQNGHELGKVNKLCHFSRALYSNSRRPIQNFNQRLNQSITEQSKNLLQSGD